jgi:hypothetical protein
VNEHIKQLAEQAVSAVDIVTGNEALNDELAKMYIPDCFAEKFAELILQECFQVCMNEGASYEEKAAGAYQSNLYVTAIKKHFGVEGQVTESNEWHTCPYAEEIHGDYETLCDCDEEQQYQCSRDI